MDLLAIAGSFFASPSGIEGLKQTDHWFGDGTFKVVPQLFYQLYTIHALQGGSVFPPVFCLIEKKDEPTYRLVLQQVKVLVDGKEPLSFLTDFESAMWKALENVYPATVVSGCFFHLCQSIWRKLQSFGLQAKYCEDEEFALFARMIPALAFFKENEVSQAFDELSEIAPVDLIPVLDYFQASYVGLLCWINISKSIISNTKVECFGPYR